MVCLIHVILYTQSKLGEWNYKFWLVNKMLLIYTCIYKSNHQTTCRNARNSYVWDMGQQHNKKLYSYCKSMKSNSSGVAPLKKDGASYSEAHDKAEILNDQFSSEYTTEDMTSFPDLGSSIAASVPPLQILRKEARRYWRASNHIRLWDQNKYCQDELLRKWHPLSPQPWLWYTRLCTIKDRYQMIGKALLLYGYSRNGIKTNPQTTDRSLSWTLLMAWMTTNRLTPFCWIFQRHLIKWHRNAWPESYTTTACGEGP